MIFQHDLKQGILDNYLLQILSNLQLNYKKSIQQDRFLKMISKIGIQRVNNIAFNNVNRLTSTIKSTLQKGNNLIRSQLNISKQNQKIIYKQKINNPQIIGTDQQINALSLYEKIKPYVGNNQKVKKNIINILNFAQIKWKEFCDLPNKSGHHYNQYLQTFKVFCNQIKVTKPIIKESRCQTKCQSEQADLIIKHIISPFYQNLIQADHLVSKPTITQICRQKQTNNQPDSKEITLISLIGQLIVANQIINATAP